MTREKSRRRQSAQPWIIAHQTGWCATFRNARPDPDALTDRTACGHYVSLRWGSKRGKPTCSECLQRIARRRKR